MHRNFRKSNSIKASEVHRRVAKRRSGMALLMTMLVLMGALACLLVGIVGQTRTNSGVGFASGNGMLIANLGAQTDESLDIAEAGVDYTRLWLTNQSAPPSNTTAFAPTLWGATVAGTTPPKATIDYPNSASSFSYFSVTVYPGVNNNGSTLKQYLVESVGVYGSEKVILHVYVQESSFAKYALFINNNGGGYWSSNNRFFDGPVHLNGGTTQGILWIDNTSPLFDYTGPDAYTVSMSSIIWAHNNSSTGQGIAPSTSADWATVCAGGPSTVAYGQAAISMPTQSYEQEYAALGQAIPNPAATAPSTGVPTAFGVTVEANGGIFINGNVNQMTLSVNNSVNQVVTLYQVDSSGNTYSSVVTINAQTNTTTLVVTKTPTSGLPVITTTNYSGTTNGVVYVNGNIGGSGIGGLNGVIADNVVNSSGTVTHTNALTIATPSSDDVNFDGSIVVNTPRQQATNSSNQPLYRNTSGAETTSSTNAMPVYVPENQDTGNFLSHAGTIGVVTNTVEMLDYTYDSTGTVKQAQLNNYEIDAAVLTYNTYQVYNYNTRPVGTYLNMGAYLITNAANINVANSNGTLTNGPYLARTYDARLLNNPPPYFPTTGISYDVLSWQRVGATLQ